MTATLRADQQPCQNGLGWLGLPTGQL